MVVLGRAVSGLALDLCSPQRGFGSAGRRTELQRLTLQRVERLALQRIQRFTLERVERLTLQLVEL